MKEYYCSALINGESYDFQTIGCTSEIVAHHYFRQYLYESFDVNLAEADEVSISRQEIEF